MVVLHYEQEYPKRIQPYISYNKTDLILAPRGFLNRQNQYSGHTFYRQELRSDELAYSQYTANQDKSCPKAV